MPPATAIYIPRLRLMSPCVSSIIAVINAALDGKGSISIHASSRGMKIVLNGRTLAKGKTPKDLHENLEARLAQISEETP